MYQIRRSVVSPLSVTGATSIQKFHYLYNSGSGVSVPYNSRCFDGPRSTVTDPVIASIMSDITDITAALFQGEVCLRASDHIITFKADFYILGTSNWLQVSQPKAAEQSQPWFLELSVFEQTEMGAFIMRTEQQFNLAANNWAKYVVLTRNETNVWGEPRGYRIVPGWSDFSHTTLKSPWLLKGSELA